MFLADSSVDEMAFNAEVVVEAGVDRGELLQGLHLSEARYRPLSSSEREMRVFALVVGAATYLLPLGVAQFVNRGFVGS